MALQLKTTIKNYVDITFDESYHKIDSVLITKNTSKITVSVYGDVKKREENNPITMKTFNAPTAILQSREGESMIEKAYNHLKISGYEEYSNKELIDV